MDLRTMQYFLAVADAENITRAAEKLHMAQPPLSRRIQALEDELAVPLFIRGKRRMILTEEGQFLRKQFEQILELTDKTIIQLNEMKGNLYGTLYVGSIETVGSVYLPEWIAEFKALNPSVRYNLWSGSSDDVIDRLERGLLDVALIREPYNTNRFEAFQIKREDWYVVMHESHPLAQNGRDYITLSELSKEPLIVPTKRRQEVTSWFKTDVDIFCEFAPLMNGIVLTEKNLGMAICPESAKFALIGRPLAIRRIDNPGKETGVSLIWHKGNQMSKVTRQFIDFVIKTCQAE
jgi:DNA-binding transcriptional LysR family regulator